MSDRIVGRPIKEGHEHESEWPPKYGNRGSSGYFVIRYKDKDGNLHKQRTSDSDECVSINVSEPPKIEPNAPLVVGDEMPPLESMATYDKKVFTSKSAYRRHLKALGYRETGGEHLKDVSRAETAREKEERHKRNLELTKQTLMDIKYDRIEFTEQEKETFNRERRAWGENYILKVKS